MLWLYSVSGFDGKFTLKSGFPLKPLSDPSATVESAGLKASRLQQHKGGDGLIAPLPKKMTISDLSQIKAAKIECDAADPNVRMLSVVLIGGEREMVDVYLSTTVLEIYAHCKALSGMNEFKLCGGYPPADLTDFEATVESAKLMGMRIIQKRTGIIEKQSKMQVLYIGGEKEMMFVNQTTTVGELYAYAKKFSIFACGISTKTCIFISHQSYEYYVTVFSASGYGKRFTLWTGVPGKALTNPEVTVASVVFSESAPESTWVLQRRGGDGSLCLGETTESETDPSDALSNFVKLRREIQLVKSRPVVVDDMQKTSEILVAFIGGRRERVMVNHSTAVSELYGHVKSLSHQIVYLEIFADPFECNTFDYIIHRLSAYKGRFCLKAGFPLNLLSDLDATVKSEHLMGSRVQQKAGIDMVSPTEMVLDDSERKTTVELLLIDGKRVKLEVNMSSNVMQIYAHCKLLSISPLSL